MNKKYGLGKGLGALIPEENESENINRILIEDIKSNNEQPRKQFQQEKINELSLSIKEHGIIQPLILKREDNYYKIIAGERRWRAAKLAGLKEVPAVIMDITDDDILEISLIENIQREDLNPIEEAEAYRRLIDQFSLTHEELSRRIGKSRTSLTNSIRILNLDERVRQLLVQGELSEGHGRALLGVEDKDTQYSISKRIIDEKLSVRETEFLVKNIGKKPKHKNGSNFDQYYLDVASKMEEMFGTKVRFTGKKNKGKIEIQYFSEDDLDRILETLKL